MLFYAEHDVKQEPEEGGAAGGDREHAPGGFHAFISRHGKNQQRERQPIAENGCDRDIERSDREHANGAQPMRFGLRLISRACR